MWYAIISIAVFAAVILYIMIAPAKPLPGEQTQPDDELLHNPETGEKFSVDEVEATLTINEEDLNRIIPGEELEKSFSPEQRNIEELKNALKQKGHRFVEAPEHLWNGIEKSSLVYRDGRITIAGCIELSKAAHAFITEITDAHETDDETPIENTTIIAQVINANSSIRLKDTYETFSIKPAANVHDLSEHLADPGCWQHKSYIIHSDPESSLTLSPEMLIDHAEKEKVSCDMELAGYHLFLFSPDPATLQITEDLMRFTRSLAETLRQQGFVG